MLKRIENEYSEDVNHYLRVFDRLEVPDPDGHFPEVIMDFLLGELRLCTLQNRYDFSHSGSIWILNVLNCNKP